MHFEKLLTHRLHLRPLSAADLPFLLDYFQDPVATRYLPFAQPTQAFAQTWLDRQLSRYKENYGGLCAVELRSTGELIGQCGLIYQWVDHIPKWEVGYHFSRPHWGNGYATEAAIACRDAAFVAGIAETLISIIHPDNLPSQAVAQRNGMSHWKDTVFKGIPVKVFRIRRADWELMHRPSTFE